MRICCARSLENRIEAIIHFAGSIVVPESVSDPLGYYDNNTGNTRVLASAAVKAGIDKLIFSSTAAVYGTPASAEPVKETAPLLPEKPLWPVQADERDHEVLQW